MLSLEQQLIKTCSILSDDRWVHYTEEKWNLRSEKVRYTLPGKELPAIEGILYLDKKGRVVNPPLNAFLPFVFIPTATKKTCQLYHQWVDLTKIMALDIKKRGHIGGVAFPPGFIDGRAFTWAGLNISVRYTFVGELPFEDSNLDTSVRTKVRKALKNNYSVERTQEWDKLVYCLRKTTDYKGMVGVIQESDLIKLHKLFGDDFMYAHVCLSEKGNPVSGQVKFAMPDGMCIDWAAGTDRDFIRDGVNQLLYYEALREIEKTGTKYFNYCGANIENVASAKAEWGFPLVPYVVLEGNPCVLYVKQKGLQVQKSIRKRLNTFKG